MASLVSVIILANRIVFGEFAANIKFLHSQGYSPLCESSINIVVSGRANITLTQYRFIYHFYATTNKFALSLALLTTDHKP